MAVFHCINASCRILIIPIPPFIARCLKQWLGTWMVDLGGTTLTNVFGCFVVYRVCILLRLVVICNNLLLLHYKFKLKRTANSRRLIWNEVHHQSFTGTQFWSNSTKCICNSFILLFQLLIIGRHWQEDCREIFQLRTVDLGECIDFYAVVGDAAANCV